MCRVWGVSYGPKGPEGEPTGPVELAQSMFPNLVHLGPDAWGWMSFSAEQGIEVNKHVGRCDTPKAARAMKGIDPDALWVVGHTRKATHGDPANLLNDHPIRHGNIVGVHNGVIRNYREILKITGRDKEGTEVDSEAIFAAVHRWGNVEGLRRVQGDMVACYVDLRKPRTLQLARSSGRTVFVSRTPNGSLLFASEEQALERSGWEITEPSPVSKDRLLYIRRGEITKRRTYRFDWRKSVARPTPTRASSLFNEGGSEDPGPAVRALREGRVPGHIKPEVDLDEVQRMAERALASRKFLAAKHAHHN